MCFKVIKHVLFFLMVLLVSTPCESASTLKDCFKLGKLGDTTYHLVWMLPPETHHNLGMPQYVDSMFVVDDNANTILTNWGGYPEDASLLIQAVVDDIIDRALFEGTTKTFANNLISFGVELPEMPIVVNGPEDVFLGFVTYDVLPNLDMPSGYELGTAYYGWVGLHVDGEDITLLGSYVDLDGNAVIAGKYESAIPEPSNVLLLLVGCATLMLRREGHVKNADEGRQGDRVHLYCETSKPRNMRRSTIW